MFQPPVEPWLCGFLPPPLRSRLLRLSSCQLLLLEPGGVRGSRAGQGFPQGRGGPGHHVGHRRLRLQRLRLSHGQSVSALPVWASPLGFLGIWLLRPSKESCETWALLLLCNCRECASENGVLQKILIYIYIFLNSHAYYYTESKSNTWLSVSAVRKKPQDFLLVEREHRLKDVIKTRKLQDRLVLPWTPPRKVTLTPSAHVLVL